MELKPGYKETEVGVIPVEWDAAHLGAKTTKVGSGITPTGGARIYKHEGRPFVRSQNVGWGGLLLDDIAFIDDDTHYTFQNTEIEAGDVLLNITGASIGRSAVADARVERGNVNQHVCIIRTNHTDLHPRFLNYFLLSAAGQRQIDSFQTGGNRQGLNFGQVRSIRLPLPPPPEQCAIADALSDIDALLCALDRFIAKKRDLKQAVVQQLVNGETRLPGFRDDWKSSPISRLAPEIIDYRGRTPLKLGMEWGRGDIPALSARNVKMGRIDFQEETYYGSEALYKRWMTSGHPRKGDVVMTTEAPLGNVALIPDNRKYILSQRTILLKTDPSIAVSTFLLQVLMGRRFQNLLYENSSGSTAKGIQRQRFEKLELLLPEVPEQVVISQVLSDMDAELAALEQRREKTGALKQAMMQELLSGRIRLISSAASTLTEPRTHKTVKSGLGHNRQINEAVIIGVLAKHFGSERWPLARKRCTKLTYLLHRHCEEEPEGYLKKAAGPYNPATRYKGPEKVAHENGYIRTHNNGKYQGFVAAANIGQAESYFKKWYGVAPLAWLEQFHFHTTDELELLATVDMAIVDLKRAGKRITLRTVKRLISDHREWNAKLERATFSDTNITRAIQSCRELFA